LISIINNYQAHQFRSTATTTALQRHQTLERRFFQTNIGRKASRQPGRKASCGGRIKPQLGRHYAATTHVKLNCHRETPRDGVSVAIDSFADCRVMA
jgi:hypothetical protein